MALGGRDECIPMFMTPTMECDTLCNENTMWEEYWPKIILYTLNELFHVFDQVKWQRGTDKNFIVAYEILCLSML